MEKKSKIGAVVALKCPRCGNAPLFYNKNPYRFKNMGKMYKECSNCGQDFVIEPGFYFGAAMISYIIQVLVIAFSAIGVYFLGGTKSIHYILWIIGMILLTTPYVMVLSRSIWLSFFVRKNEAQ